jgi:hypothetical protein
VIPPQYSSHGRSATGGRVYPEHDSTTCLRWLTAAAPERSNPDETEGRVHGSTHATLRNTARRIGRCLRNGGVLDDRSLLKCGQTRLLQTAQCAEDLRSQTQPSIGTKHEPCRLANNFRSEFNTPARIIVACPSRPEARTMVLHVNDVLTMKS